MIEPKDYEHGAICRSESITDAMSVLTIIFDRAIANLEIYYPQYQSAKGIETSLAHNLNDFAKKYEKLYYMKRVLQNAHDEDSFYLIHSTDRKYPGYQELSDKYDEYHTTYDDPEATRKFLDIELENISHQTAEIHEKIKGTVVKLMDNAEKLYIMYIHIYLDTFFDTQKNVKEYLDKRTKLFYTLMPKLLASSMGFSHDSHHIIQAVENLIRELLRNDISAKETILWKIKNYFKKESINLEKKYMDVQKNKIIISKNFSLVYSIFPFTTVATTSKRIRNQIIRPIDTNYYPLIIRAHGQLTGTRCNLLDDNIIIYTMTNPGLIVYDHLTDDLSIFSQCNMLDKDAYSPEESLNTLEGILKTVANSTQMELAASVDYKDLLNLSYSTHGGHLKKHQKISGLNYKFNEMIISFETSQEEILHRDRELASGRSVSGLSLQNGIISLYDYLKNDCGSKTYINKDKYFVMPPECLSIPGKPTEFYLSDIINYFGSRPYILMNCRVLFDDIIDDHFACSVDNEKLGKCTVSPLIRQTSYGEINIPSEAPHEYLKKYYKYKTKINYNFFT